MAKLQHEAPVAAIMLLEVMLREGAGEDEATLIKELRELQANISSWVAEAGEAGSTGDYERALKLVGKVLQVAPRHPPAMRQLAKLQGIKHAFEERRDLAVDALGRAEFETAQHLLHKCLEILPARGDIRELLRTTSERARKHTSALKLAYAAAKRKRCLEALGHIEVVLRGAPKSSQAVELGHELSCTVKKTGLLLAEARQQIAHGKFTHAEWCLSAIEQLQTDIEELEVVKKELGPTKRAYLQAIGHAKRVRARRDLSEASKLAERTLRICPESPEALALADSITQDQGRAQECLTAARDLLRGAEFHKATRKVTCAREVWPALGDVDRVETECRVMRNRYRAQIHAAEQALSNRQFDYALQACDAAISLCPLGMEPERLRMQIQATREAAETLRKRIIIAVGIVAGLVVLVTGTYLLWLAVLALLSGPFVLFLILFLVMAYSKKEAEDQR